MMGVNFFYHAGQSASPVAVSCHRPYERYPIEHLQHADVQLWWEGCCYLPLPQRHNWLRQIAKAAAMADWQGCQAAINALHEAGGEFACWVQAGDYLLFFNDWLGRLPVYTCQQANSLFVGRSLSQLFEHHPKAPDQLGLAQYLWAGYSLGQRTLFRQVACMPAGTCRVWHLPGLQLVFHHSKQLTVGEGPDQSAATYAQQLQALFVDACRRMTATGTSEWHLSLSGGQDSKAVLAGMQQAGAALRSSSFLMPGAEKDVKLAGELAARAAVPWQAYPIGPDCHDAQWLIQLKQGLNYSGMAFIKYYLQQVAHQHAGATLLTGDGGDVILPYFGEATTPRSKDALVNTLLRRHAIASPALATAVAGLQTADLAQSIYDLLGGYPEADLNNQSAHFAFYERIGKAYFEGEDRNRYFLWCTTPFYDPTLVKLAMEIPQPLKRNYRLYYQFLLQLCPDWAHLPDAGGGRPGSFYFHGRKWVRENFRSTPPVVKSSLRQLNQWLQAAGGGSRPRSVPMPPDLQMTCSESAWQRLTQKANHETCLYLETLSNVFG